MDTISAAIDHIVESSKACGPDYKVERSLERAMERFVAEMAEEMDLARIPVEVQKRAFRRLATEANREIR